MEAHERGRCIVTGLMDNGILGDGALIMAEVTLKNVTISYARHPAVHHVSGTFAAGSLTAITGPNGAGKSTLLKAIAGMITPDEGSIQVTGTEKGHIAYMPQSSDLDRTFPLNLLHLVAMGAWNQAGGFATITSQLKAKAREALTSVGLQGFEKRALSSLSAGQFQRVLFARLLMQDARLILLDEPFNAIDAHTTDHLLALIVQWQKEGRTVICVLHDFDQIRKHFPSCLLLARECVAWGAPTDVLHPEQLLKARLYPENWARNPEICKQVL